MNILVLNGPNLNFLGIREPNIYGNKTYNELVDYLNNKASNLGITIDVYQSNHEGDLIDMIQKAYFDKVDGIIINPGALTHYSYALYDAIKSINIPCVEVHLTNITNRDDFRKISVIKDACVKTYMGNGFTSYLDGINYLLYNKEENSCKLN